MLPHVRADKTTREQGGLIGADLGAGSGRYHRQYRRSYIGGPVGLLTGVGDHLMAQERRQQDQAAENERELERLRSENQRLREQRIER